MKTLHILDQNLWFPPLSEADADGLLAAGGDLSTARLLEAYRRGIFPWYEGDIPLWWSPDPRFVLYPQHLYVSKSMKTVIKRGTFSFSRNHCFGEVIRECGMINRPGQHGTWIQPEVVRAFEELHALGHVHSFEAWHNGQLAGGLYGVKLGDIFFGESMFAKQSNASKAAFIWAVGQLMQEG
ncbi:MAG: leucyl/phenylalanyl-tRNA--protein transferase, partial [Chitinophagaceae bacterium]|nr:leucyl/phenylalanyl-tRNA--protein transferase [Chitinophagaceae bacterium]